MSPEGRRRWWWSGTKTVLALAAVGGLGWGAVEIAAALRGRPQPLTSAEAVPVKEIDFATDGVLPREWVVQTLALPPRATLMQLDLYRLRERLMAAGQVRTATLTRTFPATLTVSISEQSPVARVMAQTSGAEPEMLLVARDGTVFAGLGFDPELLKTLPWLDGVKLKRDGGKFEPIADMPTVADLLGKAKLEAEHLYREWQVVSLARLESDGEIEVHATNAACIRFGTSEDFFRQLARLDSLLDAARAKTDRPVREIDLAIGAHVPVAFEEVDPTAPLKQPGEARPAPTTTTRRNPVVPAFPDQQRKTTL